MKNNEHLKYLITSEQDARWGLIINSVGFQRIKSNEVYPPKHHPTRYFFSSNKGRILNEYQLLYISEGKGNFVSSNYKKSEIKAGNMFLLFPREWHNYAPQSSSGWNEYWIGFEGVNIDSRVKDAFFDKKKCVFNIGRRKDIVDLYMQAIEIAKQQQAGYQQLLAGIVNYLLGIAYSHNKLSSFIDLNVTNQIERAKIIIYENFNEIISAEDIAEQVNMSYSWFRRVFKQYTGLSPHQYIQEIRMQKSKELLTNTQLTSQEIAYSVGFENSDYFCTAFKKNTKESPIQYRKRTQGNLLDK